MKEVAPNIFVVHLDIGFRKFKLPVNVYILAGRDGIVFDSGFGTKKSRNKLACKISDISKLMKERGRACAITRAMSSHGHWDHFSGLYHLQKDLDFDIFATPKQASRITSKKAYIDAFQGEDEFLKNPIVKKFTPFQKVRHTLLNKLHITIFKVCFVTGQVKNIDESTNFSVNGDAWQVIHLPGHCDDDIVLYNEEKGILLAGDVVLRSITTWLGPPKSDLNIYIKSLERILELPNLKLILPAHGSPIENPRKRVQEAIEHREKRTREVFELIMKSGEKGISLEKIFKSFYPRLTVFQRSILCGWIVVTLQYLIEKKSISYNREKRNPVFRVIKP